MNTNVESNKKYIREHIHPHEQKQFSSYFLALLDSQHFEEWTASRTAEVVAAFKQQKIQHQPQSPKGKQPNQGRKDSPKVEVPTAEVKTQGKTMTTSLNLLEEIEQKKAIRASASSKKAQKEQNWLNISNFSQFLTNSDPTKFNTDLFKNFDTLIIKPNQDIANASKSPTRMSMPVLSAKKQAEKKRKNMSLVQGDRTSVDKEKGKSGKDKLFKVRLKQKIACRKAQGNIQVKSITITHHEMIHRIFLPDYAMYFMEVQLPSSTATCKRTYNDFTQLRSTLHHLYPYVKTPFLQRSSWLSQNDIQLIQKNKIHLQMFMQGIIEHPLLARLPLVQSFLSIPEHKRLKAYFQGIEKTSPPRGLAEICSPSGSIQVQLSSQQYELIGQLPRWQSIFQSYLEKYGDLLGSLSGHLELIDQSYCELQKLTAEMQAVLKQLTERNTQIERQEDFEAFFRRQEEYYAGRKTENETQIIALTETLIPLVKYERMNIAQFKPLFEDVQKLTQKYLKRLQNEPESPCSSEQIPKLVANHRLREDLWEQSQNMQFFKVQLGYLHSSLLQETHLFSSRLMDTLGRVWNQLYGNQPKQGQGQKERLSIKCCS